MPLPALSGGLGGLKEGHGFGAGHLSRCLAFALVLAPVLASALVPVLVVARLG